MHESGRDAVFLQGSFERGARPAGDETPSGARAAEVAENVRNVDALSAEIELLSDCSVHMTELEIADLHNAVDGRVERHGVDHLEHLSAELRDHFIIRVVPQIV